MELEKIFKTVVENSAADLLVQSKKSLAQQGHFLTGRLADSLVLKYKIGNARIFAELLALEYGVYVNKGVPASRIPFTRGRGKSRGRRSKYIAGLISYWRKRGITEAKEAKRAAFATAHKHKKEGMPTKASARFSKNGKRTGAFEDAWKANAPAFSKKVAQRMGPSVERFAADLFKKNIA